MTRNRKRPPTVAQLLRLLNRVRVRCINRFSAVRQVGEWRPDENEGDEIVGTIVLATRVDSRRAMDALVMLGLHELCHAFFSANCRDDRHHEDKVYRWEALLFRSRALREAMAVRIGNSYIYGKTDP